MGQASINEIEAELREWELLKQLPPQVGSFVLQPGSGIAGQILNIAAYVDEEMHCRLDLTYTSETFDYVPVKTVGLHTFRDVRYFCRDREHFAELLLPKLPQLLADIDRRQQHELPYEAAELHFEQWEYWRSLPRNLQDFELYITPDRPLRYINGSYIFLDYVDFAQGNELYFSYNVFRNELFAELHKQRLPLTTNAFDVRGSVPDHLKLAALEEKLKELLEPTLAELNRS